MQKALLFVGLIALLGAMLGVERVGAVDNGVSPDIAVLQNIIQDLVLQVANLQRQIEQLQLRVATQSQQIDGQGQEIAELRRGDRGEVVRRAQYALRDDPQVYPEGYVTGYYGSLTQRAVERFQEKNSLPVSGVLTSSTINQLVEKTCTPTPIPTDLSAPREVDDTQVLTGLSENGRAFYLQSKEVRSSYLESHPYKKFLLISFSLYQMDPDGYFHPPPGRNCYVPNPANYSDIPSEIPPRFYRLVKDCATNKTIQRQVIDTTAGYANYIGRDRYSEQCVLDGTADNYYVESLERLE